MRASRLLLVRWGRTLSPKTHLEWRTTMMNLVTNILYNQVLNQSGNIASTPNLIYVNYAAFPHLAAGTLVDLEWVVFFGAAMVCVVQ
jgi:hypothetical protein